MGVDKNPTRFIKASPSGMAVLLTNLINTEYYIIILHTFPDVWENGIVIRFKKLTSLSNFHPFTIYLFSLNY